MIDLAPILSSPVFTHVVTFVLGLGFIQPALIANFWKKVLGVAQTVAKAEDLVKLIDAMLKTNGLIPADQPVPPLKTVQQVAEGKLTVAQSQVLLKVAKPALKKKR